MGRLRIGNRLRFTYALDLVFERTVDVPRELVWAARTNPEQIKQWFTPDPWKTVDCEIDLRPGGIFRTIMRSPEGQDFPNVGCYLEVVKNERLIWTDALQPGYRPSKESQLGFFFTAAITFEAHGNGTKYTAMVTQKDEESRKKHEDMGFHEGWGKAFDQLVAMIKKKPKPLTPIRPAFGTARLKKSSAGLSI